MPQLSIIIPVYNTEKYLHRCIDSVLLQSFTDYELLLIDDGSTDGSGTICDEYAAKNARIRVFHKENGGVSSARNLGLDKANGEWILFADADDFYYNGNILQELSAAIDQNPSCELLYFPGGVLLENGEAYQDSYNYQIYKTAWDLCEEHGCLPKCLVFGCIYAQCYKRSVIEENQIRMNPSLKYAEDRLFVMTYCMFAKQSIVLANPFYCYRMNPNSLVHNINSSKFQQDNIVCAQTIFQLAKINHKQLTQNISKYIRIVYLMGALNGNNRKNVDWVFVFRNSKTLKLLIKSFLMWLHIL